MTSAPNDFSRWSRLLRLLPIAGALALALSLTDSAPRAAGQGARRAAAEKASAQKSNAPKPATTPRSIVEHADGTLSKADTAVQPITILDDGFTADVAGEESGERERQETDGDADVPRFLKGRIDKEEYNKRRGGWVAMMRGLDTAQPDSRARAMRQMAQQETRLGLKGPNAARTSILNPTTWTFVGPNPIPNGQTSTFSSAVSGRVSALAVDPTDENVVFAGAAGGGVYRTLDGGTTWTPVLDSALTSAIGAIAISPSDPTIVYVGTGEAGGSADSFFGVGIYRITAAKSGSPVVEGPFNQDGAAADVFTYRSVAKIVVHPTDPGTIFVATASGVGGNPQSTLGLVFPARGVYRSTNATAANPVFAKLPVGATGDFPYYDLVMEPGNPDNILTTVNTTAANGGGVWRTTNANAADPTTVVFTRTLTLVSVRAELAINKVGPTVTVVVASGETTPIGTSCTAAVQGGVRISSDGGITWSAAPLQSAGGFCSAQCFYDIFVALDPGDANKIYLGGAADSSSSNPCRSSISMLSTNGGATFTRNSDGLHADSHAVAVAPTNTNVVYTGNDGGIFKSIDGGANWTSLNNTFVSATQFQSIAVHPRHPKFTIGGTQDNGTNGMNTAGAWNRIDFGDGGYALIDQSSYDTTGTMTMYHTYFNQINAIVGFGRVLPGETAQDNGWTFLGFGGIPNGIPNQNVIFYAPMALGPGTPNNVYFAGDKLYRSTDRGTSFTQVSQFMGDFVHSIAVSPQDDNYRLIGLRLNGVIAGTSTGANPLTIMTPVGAPARGANRVIFDPNDKNTAWVTYGGFGVAAGAHVWKTTNFPGGSATWAPAGNGIPDVPVNSIVVDPMDSNRVYVATDIGVYGTSDGGANWVPIGSGLPRVAVFDLAIQSQSRTLRIATHGRGMWEIQIPGAITPVAMVDLVSSSSAIIGGNGNGFLETGEDAGLTITLSNTVGASATATAVSATITTSTPGITILSGTSAYANLAPGATGANLSPLTFHVDSTALCGTVVEFTVTVNYSGDTSSPRVFTMTVPTGAPGTESNTPYAGAPVFIPDSPAAAVTATQVVSGVVGAINKITFSIDGTVCDTLPLSTTVGMDHTFVGDVAMSLTSPGGTTVRLTTSSNNNGRNFCNTLFDDAAATAWVDANGAMEPFIGSFRPVDPLSAFAGEDANGTWTLTMQDGGAGDTGTLRAFTIHVTPAACSTPFPSAFTGAATSLTDTTATLNATVNPNGFATTALFDYGLTNAYGAQVAATPAPGSGTAFVPVTGSIASLSCGTLYHYRIVATSSAGTTDGADTTFTTVACPTNTGALTARTINVNSSTRDLVSSVRSDIWYRVRLFAGRSYQVSAWPVDHEQAVDASTLSISLFSDDGGTVPAIPAPTSSSGDLEGSVNANGDALPTSVLYQPTATGVYKIRLQSTGGGSVMHPINVAVRETTLFSPWTSRAAGFEGFVEVHNNTNAAISVTLRAYDSAGAALGSGITFNLPANATDFRTATLIGVPVNVAAGIVLTHNGGFGAVSANITTLNGSTGLSFDAPFTSRAGGLQGPPVR